MSQPFRPTLNLPALYQEKKGGLDKEKEEEQVKKEKGGRGKTLSKQGRGGEKTTSYPLQLILVHMCLTVGPKKPLVLTSGKFLRQKTSSDINLH